MTNVSEMKTESIERLKSVNAHLLLAVKEMQALKNENAYLKTALGESRETSDKSRKLNAELKQEVESLEMALAIAGDGAVDKKAKNRINEMVREIDKCIALLND